MDGWMFGPVDGWLVGPDKDAIVWTLEVKVTCHAEHLQADQGLEGGGSQGAQVVPAQVQQGQGAEARQSLVSQELHAVVLQVELLQTLGLEGGGGGGGEGGGGG